MPLLYRLGRLRFRFYSADCAEPRHVHVWSGSATAKFWLEPSVELARNHGLRPNELRRAQRFLTEHSQEFKDEWDKFCSEFD